MENKDIYTPREVAEIAFRAYLTGVMTAIDSSQECRTFTETTISSFPENVQEHLKAKMSKLEEVTAQINSALGK